MFALCSEVFSSHPTISGGSLGFIRGGDYIIALYNFESSAHLSPSSVLWQLIKR